MAQWLAMKQEAFLPVIADLLKEAREEKNMSLTSLAVKSGVTRQSLSKIEKGDCNAGVYTLHLVAKGLEISLWEIIKQAESGNR